MATILWIDDRSGERIAEAETLRASGHSVTFCQRDLHAVKLIDSGLTPDVIIQDLHRFPETIQLRGRPARSLPRNRHEAGWRFYLDVLKPALPTVPVIIYSRDAENAANTRLADDYNLLILRKKAANSIQLARAVDFVLNSQRRIVTRVAEIPQVVTVDFERVNAALIRHLARKPTDLSYISWSNFEELVRTLLAEMGYSVKRTPLTRDGGGDIWALKKTELGEVLYAIDAKKYPFDKILGPEPVRAIHGVADLEHATVGMIVTTARFGPAATKIADQLRYQISLKDFDGVVSWIRLVSG